MLQGAISALLTYVMHAHTHTQEHTLTTHMHTHMPSNNNTRIPYAHTHILTHTQNPHACTLQALQLFDTHCHVDLGVTDQTQVGRCRFHNNIFSRVYAIHSHENASLIPFYHICDIDTVRKGEKAWPNLCCRMPTVWPHLWVQLWAAFSFTASLTSSSFATDFHDDD